METPYHMARKLVVSMDRQTLEVHEGGAMLARFPVSTSARGAGCESGSFRTPTGRFRIVEAIGAGEPLGTIFKARVPVGRWRPGDRVEDDLVLTRILRLDGLDPWNRNTLERFVYIHGTNDEEAVGRPAGHGCVRLRNADMIRLFEMVAVGDLLEIMAPGDGLGAVP